MSKTNSIKGLANRTSILEGFMIHNLDETDGTYYYYGYQNEDGIGIIMRRTIATEVYRYALTNDYTTMWTNKASQEYKTINQLNS